ncbi:MAG: hypothetical protein O7D94_07205, partial [Planctomycetota bacterium]|nr:hypothetical protein [Planctomycetota bacterium]
CRISERPLRGGSAIRRRDRPDRMMEIRAGEGTSHGAAPGTDLGTDLGTVHGAGAAVPGGVLETATMTGRSSDVPTHAGDAEEAEDDGPGQSRHIGHRAGVCHPARGGR